MFLTGFWALAYSIRLALVEPSNLTMNNSRSFYHFAFTHRFFSYGEGGPANCERDVLKS